MKHINSITDLVCLVFLAQLTGSPWSQFSPSLVLNQSLPNFNTLRCAQTVEPSARKIVTSHRLWFSNASIILFPYFVITSYKYIWPRTISKNTTLWCERICEKYDVYKFPSKHKINICSKEKKNSIQTKKNA